MEVRNIKLIINAAFLDILASSGLLWCSLICTEMSISKLVCSLSPLPVCCPLCIPNCFVCWHWFTPIALFAGFYWWIHQKYLMRISVETGLWRSCHFPFVCCCPEQLALTVVWPYMFCYIIFICQSSLELPVLLIRYWNLFWFIITTFTSPLLLRLLPFSSFTICNLMLRHYWFKRLKVEVCYALEGCFVNPIPRNRYLQMLSLVWFAMKLRRLSSRVSYANRPLKPSCQAAKWIACTSCLLVLNFICYCAPMFNRGYLPVFCLFHLSEFVKSLRCSSVFSCWIQTLSVSPACTISDVAIFDRL